MKFSTKDIVIYSTILVLLILLFFQFQCNGVKVGSLFNLKGEQCVNDTTILKSDTVYKYLHSEPIVIYKDKPIPKVITVTDTVIANIDTAAILADYYSRVVYQDTLTDDSTYLFYISDLVSQNRILDRSIQFKSLRPSTIITNERIITQTVKPRVKVFAGLGVAVPVGGLNFDLQPSLMILTRKDVGVSLEYAIFDQQIIASFWYKIRLKR